MSDDRKQFARDVALAAAPAVAGIVVQAIVDEVRGWITRRREAEQKRAKAERKRWKNAS